MVRALDIIVMRMNGGTDRPNYRKQKAYANPPIKTH